MYFLKKIYLVVQIPFRCIGRLIRYSMISLIRFYQIFIGPLLPPVCRFRPSCSQYFIEALQKKGLWKGTYLGVRRLLRCHPFCEGGYDPVDREDATNLEKKQ